MLKHLVHKRHCICGNSSNTGVSMHNHYPIQSRKGWDQGQKWWHCEAANSFCYHLCRYEMVQTSKYKHILNTVKWLYFVWSNFHIFFFMLMLVQIYDHREIPTLLWNLQACLPWHHPSYLINHRGHSSVWNLRVCEWLELNSYKPNQWKRSEKTMIFFLKYSFQVHI